MARRSLERAVVEKVADQARAEGMLVLGMQIGLWRYPALRRELARGSHPDPATAGLFLHPDIDLLLSPAGGRPPTLIAAEVKAIYVGKGERLSWRFYEDLDEAVGLLRFGVDWVRLMQVFIVRLEDERERVRVPEAWVEYGIPVRDIIRTLKLPIGYLPILDFTVGGELLPEPGKVVDMKNSGGVPEGQRLILPPVGNPFLESGLEYPRVIRRYLEKRFLAGV